MQIYSSYITQEKLKALSERLRYLAEYPPNANYVDRKIKSENLQYNLSLIISHIILKLQFIERSINVFENIIQEYNKTNSTNLTFADFEKICWVRIISEEVIIPSSVRRFIWKVGYSEKEEPIEIPEGKKDIVRCLQIYDELCFRDAKLTIHQSELENILSKYASKEVTIEFLKERGIIGFDPKRNLYYWQTHDKYPRHLREEIASTLWLLVGGENGTLVEFKRYFKLIRGTQIWVKSLDDYLSVQNTSKISELAIEFLNTENDLLKSDEEFRKIWFDLGNYPSVDINNEIPDFKFNYDNTFDFIESINNQKFTYHFDLSDQNTRSFCYSILNIIVNNEPKQPQPFQNTLRLLKDTERPFLVWTLYSEISSDFPFTIPYLLTESDLIPIAFKLIDKIRINDNFLKQHSNTDRKVEERFELINQLWFEMFDFTLEQFSLFHSDSEEKGKVIAKILNDLARTVFNYKANNQNSIINHNVIRKRYDEALKKLSVQRVKQTNVYPKPFINPRITISIFPPIADYLKNKLESTSLPFNALLNLESALFDLSIEILRLGNLRFGEEEISAEEKQKLTGATKDLLTSLAKYLTEFYSTNEIEVQAHNGEVKKRKVRRGVSEFGFEIIDWGYLFLHLERSNALEIFHKNFTATLSFNTSADKYDDQNKEQFEKIKLYLKSLMISFVSIKQKKNLFEIEGLPVNDTLIHIEKWIKELALLYSINDLPKKRIDVFNEMLSPFGYNMYYQHLTSLLYKCINYFTDESPNEFVKMFFASSNNIGRMLTAMNILDSKEQRDIISQRISEVKIETFIGEVFTTTELQYALIEAVNSESHWELAKPLIDRIQAHFNRVKHQDENREFLLFQVNLLLAFKEKDFSKLNSIGIPKKPYIYLEGDQKMQRIKQFYVALFKLYNDKKYDEAIKLFKSLLSEDTKNIRYAFHLYRAETLKAIDVE